MSILDIPLTAIDTETTGLATATAQVWELGIQRRGARPWSRLFRPAEPILSPEVREVCHVDDDLQRQICEAPAFSLAAAEMLRRGAEKTLDGSSALVLFNGIAYDWPLLTAECDRVGVDLPQPSDGVKVLDPQVWVNAFFRHKQRRSLTAVCEGLAPDVLARVAPHRAPSDCTMTLAVVEAMVARFVPLQGTLAEVLAWQAKEAARQARAWALWGYYVYEDGDVLMCGFGKHCGRPLLEIGDFCAWALNRFGHEMPEASRAAFEDAACGR